MVQNHSNDLDLAFGHFKLLFTTNKFRGANLTSLPHSLTHSLNHINPILPWQIYMKHHPLNQIHISHSSQSTLDKINLCAEYASSSSWVNSQSHWIQNP